MGELPVYTGLLKRLLKQKSANSNQVACSLEKPSYAKSFSDKILEVSKLSSEKLFVRMFSPTHEELMKQVFTMSMLQADAGWSATGLLPWSCGHWLMCVSGDILLIGVQGDDLQGAGYAGKLATFAAMKPDDLSQCMLAKHNFMFRLRPGDIACIPSNVVVCSKQ